MRDSIRFLTFVLALTSAKPALAETTIVPDQFPLVPDQTSDQLRRP